MFNNLLQRILPTAPSAEFLSLDPMSNKTINPVALTFHSNQERFETFTELILDPNHNFDLKTIIDPSLPSFPVLRRFELDAIGLSHHPETTTWNRLDNQLIEFLKWNDELLIEDSWHECLKIYQDRLVNLADWSLVEFSIDIVNQVASQTSWEALAILGIIAAHTIYEPSIVINLQTIVGCFTSIVDVLNIWYSLVKGCPLVPDWLMNFFYVPNYIWTVPTVSHVSRGLSSSLFARYIRSHNKKFMIKNIVYRQSNYLKWSYLNNIQHFVHERLILENPQIKRVIPPFPSINFSAGILLFNKFDKNPYKHEGIFLSDLARWTFDLSFDLYKSFKKK